MLRINLFLRVSHYTHTYIYTHHRRKKKTHFLIKLIIQTHSNTSFLTIIYAARTFHKALCLSCLAFLKQFASRNFQPSISSAYSHNPRAYIAFRKMTTNRWDLSACTFCIQKATSLSLSLPYFSTSRIISWPSRSSCYNETRGYSTRYSRGEKFKSAPISHTRRANFCSARVVSLPLVLDFSVVVWLK